MLLFTGVPNSNFLGISKNRPFYRYALLQHPNSLIRTVKPNIHKKPQISLLLNCLMIKINSYLEINAAMYSGTV